MAKAVASLPTVRKAIKKLVSVPAHEHFAGYLAILRAVREGENPRPADITRFHEDFLAIPGDPGHPYISPFRSRGHGRIAEINPNVAGSYAPSSLRPGKPLRAVIDVIGDGALTRYALRKDHATLASNHLLYKRKIPAVSLAIFLYRDYSLDGSPNLVRDTLDIFRDQFLMRVDTQEESTTFNTLFLDDSDDYASSEFNVL